MGVATFDHSVEFVVAGGPAYPYIAYKQLTTGADEFFKVPCHGVSQVQILRDPYLCAFLSTEGQFYVVDLSCQNERLPLKLHLKIPKQVIKLFDVDFNMNSVLFTCANG